MQMQWKYKLLQPNWRQIVIQFKFLNEVFNIFGERDRRFTVFARPWSCCYWGLILQINLSILFRQIWKILASYMRRHSVNENPTKIGFIYIHIWKQFQINHLNYHNSISHIGSINLLAKHAYALFFYNSIMHSNVC